MTRVVTVLKTGLAKHRCFMNKTIITSVDRLGRLKYFIAHRYLSSFDLERKNFLQFNKIIFPIKKMIVDDFNL